MWRQTWNQIDMSSPGRSPVKIQGLIIGLFILVISLEFSTPPPYVFGYLYIGAVLLTSARLSRRATFWVTSVAVALTILNLVIPGLEAVSLATVANRLIAVIALIVTGWLSDRNRCYEEAIVRQQMKLLAQEELARVREDFASTLTHDLKTPLLGAIETLTAFRQETFGPITRSQRKVLDIMSRSHQTTLQLVETLLDVYRNDTEGLHLQRQPLDLVLVAEEAIATLTNVASARQIQVRLTFDESNFRRALWVNGDGLQLQRVFVNLITNAIYHSLRGGKVDVVMSSHDTHQVVKVLDRGQGIAENDLPMLFERFYQGRGDRQTKGSGLGLYLSRQIIEAHGGTIWAEQRFPEGAMFGFRLPAHLAAAVSGARL